MRNDSHILGIGFCLIVPNEVSTLTQTLIADIPMA